tara:strand:- start:584 stop:820 length:237 start_codon:yes stop_codon:yes gene_type:complete
MARPLKPNQHWLTKDQAAEYLGKSRRLIDMAVNLKLRNLANENLRLKKVGNQILISLVSLDETPLIRTRLATKKGQHH